MRLIRSNPASASHVDGGTNEQKRHTDLPNLQLLRTTIRIWSGFLARQW
jgi:hypothetical protein